MTFENNIQITFQYHTSRCLKLNIYLFTEIGYGFIVSARKCNEWLPDTKGFKLHIKVMVKCTEKSYRTWKRL